MNQPGKPTKKIILVIVLILAAIGFAILLQTRLTKQRDGYVTITNYDSYVKNLPSSERDVIEKALFDTVTLNVPVDTPPSSVDDVVIRDGTYSQDFENNIYTTTFTVDSASLKQSYKVQNKYSELSPEESGLTDYTSLALCLDPTDLKYGEFTCQDPISQQIGVSESDPILEHLPQSTLNYSLEVDSNSKELKIIATLHLNNVDYKLGEEKAVQRYRAEIAAWFESIGLDISNYTLEYTY